MNLLGKIKRRLARRNSRITVSLAACLAAAALTGQSYAISLSGNTGTGSTGISIAPSSSGIQNIAVTQNGIINWSQFNIGQGETVNFNFSGTANGVLNRVSGGPSEIAGAINALSAANIPFGTVILVNPAGIVFANGATINVPTFIASTYNISDDMFLNQLKYGGTFTINSANSTGKIYFNGNTVLQGPTNLVAISKAISVAPGVTITATANDSGITLNSFDSYSFKAKYGDNGKLYTQLQGYTSKAGNDITIGDSSGGSALTANWVSLLGNTISVNGSESSKAKITSLGATSDASIDIIAGNGYIDPSTQTIIATATSANKIAINNTFIGLNTLSATNPSSTSARLTLAGGSIAINAADFSYGNYNNGRTNGAYILAFNNAVLSEIPNSNRYKSIAWQADSTNTINITNSNILTENTDSYSSWTSRLALLGGKIELVNTTAKVGEFFVGAGNMTLEAQTKDDNSGYWDEYYFNHELATTAPGNTVTFDKTNILANGEAAIFANSFKNTGTLNAADRWGISIQAFDKNTGNYETMQSYLDVSQNNTIINTGIITTPNGEFIANAMTNTGSIKIADGGMYMLALADNITGNSIEGSNAVSTVALGVNDTNYNAKNPFNRIIITSGGNNDDDLLIPSFARIGSLGINTNLPLAEQQVAVVEAASQITDPGKAADLLQAIISVNSKNQDALLSAALNSYKPTQAALNQSKGQINASSRPPVPAAQGISSTPSVAAPTTSTTGVTVAPAQENTNNTTPASTTDKK